MADFESIASTPPTHNPTINHGTDQPAEQFVEFYYKAFDSDRNSLAALYGHDSMLTFEASPSQGVGNIIQKLQELPFKQVQHQVATLDAQPSDERGGILVVVSGALLVEEERRPMSYAQTFQLKPRDGSYYVFNDVFRLVYPAA
ncbi:Nuclear transport factor 2 [Friedmanniomyces endolithicus]|uniref:NTF2-related export protein n=1 Tax=Friedmanniomyces endolithicus TaxID=329885 RepID=A0AAN6F8P4_9PEZI|nr:Nuclear transport factor 2 [Friedmanniomyces endolithicus]KAK0288616.1 Nuclear transport factor 2 [Friedmanniomyces endolithicus]KAK0300384.1 Nuclear transport factor 2 [Friedmanniomyces endolithicus]KAK0306549.1 Nuclear transport factor 2 [Friedmanniomyces endolithicus]KAK0316255.1 Nuclear transport factor 2 [Friedmanniomyces endolithicus]